MGKRSRQKRERRNRKAVLEAARQKRRASGPVEICGLTGRGGAKPRLVVTVPGGTRLKELVELLR